MRIRSALLPALLLLSLLSACKTPRERIEPRVNLLRQEWASNLVHQANLPEKTLDWDTALAELKATNPKLKQARMDVTNANESVYQVWRDLTPSLNLRSGLTKSIKSLGSVGPDDVTFGADSFFSIPGMVNFGSRLFAAKLFRYRAQAAYDLSEREQTIALYKLFLLSQETEAERDKLARQKATAQAIGQIDPFTGRVMQTETELRELGSAKDFQSIQDQAADILGNRSFKWKFSTNGLPTLSYDLNPLPLDHTNEVGQLQLRLVAIEYEAARAQLLGIKLRYWPDLNLFISGPPIYQRSAGREVFWDAAEVRASADLYWNIDTKGYIRRQLKQTRRQQDMQKAAFRLQAVALIDKLIFTQKLLAASTDKERQLDAQLRVLLAIPPAQNYFALEKYANDYRTMTDNQRRLRRELAELKTLFWFVDDRAWTNQLTFNKSAQIEVTELPLQAKN